MLDLQFSYSLFGALLLKTLELFVLEKRLSKTKSCRLRGRDVARRAPMRPHCLGIRTRGHRRSKLHATQDALLSQADPRPAGHRSPHATRLPVAAPYRHRARGGRPVRPRRPPYTSRPWPPCHSRIFAITPSSPRPRPYL
jgi:hypothetical protein